MNDDNNSNDLQHSAAALPPTPTLRRVSHPAPVTYLTPAIGQRFGHPHVEVLVALGGDGRQEEDAVWLRRISAAPRCRQRTGHHHA